MNRKVNVIILDDDPVETMVAAVKLVTGVTGVAKSPPTLVTKEKLLAWMIDDPLGLDVVYDVVVLDIIHVGDASGGKWVYDELCSKGLRNRWRHTVICSKNADVAPRGRVRRHYGEDDLVLWAMERGIPEESVLQKLKDGFEPLIWRLKELLHSSR